jgi:hypothetical protein
MVSLDKEMYYGRTMMPFRMVLIPDWGDCVRIERRPITILGRDLTDDLLRGIGIVRQAGPVDVEEAPAEDEDLHEGADRDES